MNLTYDTATTVKTFNVAEIARSVIEFARWSSEHHSTRTPYDALCYLSGYAPDLPVGDAVHIVWQLTEDGVLERT